MNRIIIRKCQVTHRWCVILRTTNSILETFRTRAEAIEAMRFFRASEAGRRPAGAPIGE